MKRTAIIIAVLALCAASCARKNEAPVEASENQVIETIMKRRSVRKYKDTPVPSDLLQKIAECGVNAPNGSNRQRWEVRLVNNPELIKAFTEEYKSSNPRFASNPDMKTMFQNAPAIICIGTPEGAETIDSGLMGENMILAAESLGLATCCLGGPVPFVKGCSLYSKLDFSEGYELCYMIGIGYADESPDAKPRDLGKIKFIER